MSANMNQQLEALLGQVVRVTVQGKEYVGRLDRNLGPGVTFSVPGGPEFVASAATKVSRADLTIFQSRFDELRELSPDDIGVDALRETLIDDMNTLFGLTRDQAEREVDARIAERTPDLS